MLLNIVIVGSFLRVGCCLCALCFDLEALSLLCWTAVRAATEKRRREDIEEGEEEDRGARGMHLFGAQNDFWRMFQKIVNLEHNFEPKMIRKFLAHTLSMTAPRHFTKNKHDTNNDNKPSSLLLFVSICDSNNCNKPQ